MKWSVTLTDRLGPEILTVLEIKEFEFENSKTLVSDLIGWSMRDVIGCEDVCGDWLSE